MRLCRFAQDNKWEREILRLRGFAAPLRMTDTRRFSVITRAIKIAPTKAAVPPLRMTNHTFTPEKLPLRYSSAMVW